TSGTTRRMVCRGLPMTSSANATFSATVLLFSSRKSWNTQPTRWRSRGTRRRGSFATFQSPTRTRPCDGTSSRSNNRRAVDFPEPDGPIRNTNSPLSTCIDTSSRAGWVDVLYVLDTCSSRITAGKSSHGADRLRRPAWGQSAHQWFRPPPTRGALVRLRRVLLLLAAPTDTGLQQTVDLTLEHGVRITHFVT